MSTQSPYPRLGAALELAYRDALDDWLTYHRKSRTVEDMLTHHVRSVEIVAQLQPQRYGLVTVSLTTRDPNDDATYPFVLQSTPFLGFKQAHLG